MAGSRSGGTPGEQRIAARLKKPAAGFPARHQFLQRYRYAGDLPGVAKSFFESLSGSGSSGRPPVNSLREFPCLLEK
jgi:hypothetical protein